MAYLDHAASTPVRASAREAYLSALESVGNASSVHRHGQTARAIVEQAREEVAELLACDPIEVVFTSGGTESVNLGIVGLFRAAVAGNADRRHIVVPEAEHHATLDTVLWLEKHEGARLHWVPVDATARVSPDDLAQALAEAGPRAALATVIWANNEVGTIQPVAEIGRVAVEAGIPLHLDAIAAASSEQINFAELRRATAASAGAGLATLSVSGHKVGAVPGVGAVIVARDASLEPLLHGGGQQRGLRSGTMDAPAAASLAAALREVQHEREHQNARLTRLRERVIAGVQQQVSGATLRGSSIHRLPNNVNVTFEGCQSDSLLFLLDEQGISVSTGSACQAGVARPSHVLLATGLSEAQSSSALRITLGHTTTEAEVDEFLAALPEAVRRARMAGFTA
jgi:cysteine desulfurase